LKTYLFNVFDSKTQVFCAPFCAQTHAAALRDFAYAANDKNGQIGRYPTDYTLFSIGHYDDETGLIENTQMLQLGLAAQFVQQNEVIENV
jgi:hypothetical protein